MSVSPTLPPTPTATRCWAPYLELEQHDEEGGQCGHALRGLHPPREAPEGKFGDRAVPQQVVQAQGTQDHCCEVGQAQDDDVREARRELAQGVLEVLCDHPAVISDFFTLHVWIEVCQGRYAFLETTQVHEGAWALGKGYWGSISSTTGICQCCAYSNFHPFTL